MKSKKTKKTDTILIFCAHSDDEVIGMGGTIAKLTEEGKRVITIIFTYGEKSTPNLKEEVTLKQRLIETKTVDKLLKKKSIFLGLKEANLEKQIHELKIKEKIKILIKKFNPKQIYTLSSTDPHKDHRLVNKVIMEVVEELDYKQDLLIFEVWNVVNEPHPRIYSDISHYFKIKLEALKLFKSQRHYIYPLWLSVYFKARLNGFKNKNKYSEMFYKLR